MYKLQTASQPTPVYNTTNPWLRRSPHRHVVFVTASSARGPTTGRRARSRRQGRTSSRSRVHRSRCPSWRGSQTCHRTASRSPAAPQLLAGCIEGSIPAIGIYRGMACQHDRDTVPIPCPARGRSGGRAALSSALVTWVRAGTERRWAAAWEVAKTQSVQVVNQAAGNAALEAGLPLRLVAAVA